MSPPFHRFRLQGVFARFGQDYLTAHPLPRGGAILACRTAALGGHLEACNGCGQARHVYHSCRNRHCPQCQTRAKETWLAALRSAGRAPEWVAAEADWKAQQRFLHAHDWVVYAKQPLGGPEAMLAYLGRYTHRVATIPPEQGPP